MIDELIPGFCPRPQLLVIQEIASHVQQNGQIVEVGSLFGRTAYAWASSCPPTVKLYCVDLWDGSEVDAFTGFSSRRGALIGKLKNEVETFDRFIAGRLENIEKLKIKSPPESWNRGLVDVIYIDGDHHLDGVNADLSFWYEHIKPDGIFCGDDFNEDHPNVARAVKEFAQKIDRRIFTLGKFWAIENQSNVEILKRAERVFYQEWRRFHQNV